jgi:hypothetical protein
MSTKRSKSDPRLLGVWKSDRRLTFKHYTPQHKLASAKLKKFKSIFGKLIVRWGRQFVYTDYDGTKFKDRYDILGRDSVSVVIRTEINILDELFREERVYQIFFENDDCYWFWTAWGMREFFRRIS